MRKYFNKHEDGSDDEDEEMPGESDHEMQTDEESVAGSADEDEDDEEDEDEQEEADDRGNEDEPNEEDEEEDEVGESNAHPYPTPPPDADVGNAKENMLLGNGIKKVKIESSKPKMTKEKKTKTAATVPTDDAKLPKKGGTILDHALEAIKVLDSRSGSSAKAIVAYMKSTGYEVEDETRFAKTLYKRLKAATAHGKVQQVKQSFKISVEAKKQSMAMDKMKEKQQRQKKKLKEAEAKAAEKKKEKEMKKAAKPKVKKDKEEKPKKKAAERKTKEPREKKNPKLAAAAGGAKMAAASEAMAELAAKDTSTGTPTAETKKGRGAKAKAVRKSIGTLAQHKPKPMVVEQKRIRQMVAGRTTKKGKAVDDIDSETGEPTQSSTPIAPAKQKRNQRAVK